MKSPLVAVTDSVFASLEPAYKILAKLNADIRLAKEPTPDAILEVAREADALLVTYANITSEIINELENCQVIGRFGIGVDNVDMVFDDRQQVVDMWRANGLTCFQVAEGNF